MAERSQAANPSGEDQIRALYEQAESRTAEAFETLASQPSFGYVMARMAENVAALTRMGADFSDLVLSNLRIAGRADITRLARQLQRTEDKLERVLQEVEQLGDELARQRAGDSANGRAEGSPEPVKAAASRPRNTRRATGTGQ
jgi:hypothetical protein